MFPRGFRSLSLHLNTLRALGLLVPNLRQTFGRCIHEDFQIRKTSSTKNASTVGSG